MIVNKYGGGSGSGSGERGPQGYQGPQGVEGAVGPQGYQGPAGEGGSGSGDAFILKSSSLQPSGLSLGDVYAITANTRTLKPTDVVSSVTVTYTGSEITFKFYAGDEYKTDTGGIDGNGNPYGPWGMDGDVIMGPWGSTYGIQVTDLDGKGSIFQFTTLNPGNYESSQMYGFNIDIEVSGTSYELYQAIDDGKGGATEKEKIAKVSDLPTSDQLLPINGSFNDFLRMGGEGPEWASARLVPFTDMQKDYTGAVLMSKGTYADEYGWGFIDNAVVEPVSATPEMAKDGAVYALSSSGYGIVQAQGTHVNTGYTVVANSNEWKGISGGTSIKIENLQSADRVKFKLPNADGEFQLYWNGLGWELDNITQTGGGGVDFTGETSNGVSVIITYDSNTDTAIITIGSAFRDIYTGNDWDDTSSVYSIAGLTVADYTNVVMSEDVTKIKKMTQAAYDALTVKDPNTLYIIIETNTGV